MHFSCPRYPALVGPVEQDFDKNRLKSDMKAFRLDGSYDIQIQCTIMFCAGPNGCPPVSLSLYYILLVITFFVIE